MRKSNLSSSRKNFLSLLPRKFTKKVWLWLRTNRS